MIEFKWPLTLIFVLHITLLQENSILNGCRCSAALMEWYFMWRRLFWFCGMRSGCQHEKINHVAYNEIGNNDINSLLFCYTLNWLIAEILNEFSLCCFLTCTKLVITIILCVLGFVLFVVFVLWMLMNTQLNWNFKKFLCSQPTTVLAGLLGWMTM